MPMDKFPEFESVEEELELYKRLIGNLPIDLDVLDEQTNIRIRKQKGDSSFAMVKGVAPSDAGKSRLVFPSGESRFQQLEAFLQPMFDLVPHHITFINKDGIITLCNEQTVQDLNEVKENVMGRHISRLLKIDECEIKLLETLNTGKEFVNEEILDTNYGIINTRIIYDTDGSILRVIGLFHFMNHLKEAEKMAMIGQISASIAHEVRNPLTTVRGFLQLLGQEELKADASIFRTLLIPELDRANKIITDFLLVTKPAPLTKEPELVTELVAHFAGLVYSEAILKKADFTVDISGELEGARILVNQSELLQVFINLFNNALESKGQDGLRIRLECERDRRQAIFRFIDNGVGIEPQHLNYIFDPFFSTKEEGTGLGLSLSKKIIELHGGSLTVASTPGIGTQFTIKIPLI